MVEAKETTDHFELEQVGKYVPATTSKIEEALHHHHDAALDILGSDRVEMTEIQSRYVCRKIDKNILPWLLLVYMLQYLDKNVIGYGATFGLVKQAHLVGNQYSVMSSSGFWAQLAWQPFSAWLIVKIPNRILVTALVGGWGSALVGMAFAKTFSSLLGCRFLLGLFEAGSLPLFGIITATWYRRSEQPLRIAVWYCGSGAASIFGSLIAYALSFANDTHLFLYQILFLMTGLLTVCIAPLLYWRMDNNPAEARFLTLEERAWAVERLRDNNTGMENKAVKWGQVKEALLSPLIWLYIIVQFANNVGIGVTTAFGPLIINGFGFDARQTLLLNIPFGVLQILFILSAAFIAIRYKYKAPLAGGLLVCCVVGCSLLYGLGRGAKYEGGLLVGYYLLASVYAAVPLVISWLVANIAGHTKKTVAISLYQGAGAAGNIVAPLLFTTAEAPYYHKGLQACLGIFSANIAIIFGIYVLLRMYNHKKEKERVAIGKPAKITDLSMNQNYEARVMEADGQRLGDNAFLDLTDRQNDEFVYAY